MKPLLHLVLELLLGAGLPLVLGGALIGLGLTLGERRKRLMIPLLLAGSFFLTVAWVCGWLIVSFRPTASAGGNLH